MDKQYLQLLQAMPIFGGIHEQALELKKLILPILYLFLNTVRY